MATAEECRKALETLTGRMAGMNPADRAATFPERTMSCRVTDLGVMFVTRIGPHGADEVREATPQDKQAQVRFTAKSDDLVWVSEDLSRFPRAWMSGKIKVEASIMDILQLRKFL